MPTNVLYEPVGRGGGSWQLGGDTVMYRSVGLRDERRRVSVSGTHSTAGGRQLVSWRASAGGRNSPESGWVGCAAGRFAFANAFSGRKLHRSRLWADKAGRQWRAVVCPLIPWPGNVEKKLIDFWHRSVLGPPTGERLDQSEGPAHQTVFAPRSARATQSPRHSSLQWMGEVGVGW